MSQEEGRNATANVHRTYQFYDVSREMSHGYLEVLCCTIVKLIILTETWFHHKPASN